VLERSTRAHHAAHFAGCVYRGVGWDSPTGIRVVVSEPEICGTVCKVSDVDLVVVMGVSGSGKTTVARGIAEAMGWEFAEGDEFHSEANVAKMASGHPLTDEDRWPWLRAIGAWLKEHEEAGRSAVVTCSALRRVYRDLLREGRPNVRLCHVEADAALIKDRVDHRTGHYMPPSLLPSQLATLEPLQPDEPGAAVSVAGTPEAVVERALEALGLEPEGVSL
jgi:gluconokinase